MDWAEWRARTSAPPFVPLAPLLGQLPVERWPAEDDWNYLAAQQDLRNAHGLPLRFVPASEARTGALAFERRILEHGAVETRARSWHDAFHACAWLLFPRAKARINALHVELGESSAPNARSPQRDLLTLFDESGIVIACSEPELAALLAGFQWHELFWNQRAKVEASMEFCIFGHALYEHCHTLHDGVTGKGIVVPVRADYFTLPPAQRLAQLDAAVAQFFADPARLTGPRDLQPLPVKGVPGWAAENANPAYYLDERQFRPGRMRDAARLLASPRS